MARKNDIRKPSVKRDMLLERDVLHELREIAVHGGVEKFESIESLLHDVHRNIHPKKAVKSKVKAKA